MMTLPPVYLLRHGETEWNVAGRMQGWSDSALTARGRRQAEMQGRILARVLSPGAALRVSPSGRARTTAEIALPDLVAGAIPDPRLREVNLGDWTGRSLSGLASENPGLKIGETRHLWKFAAPGGETLDAMVARCRAVLDDLTGPTVLVTHGVTLRLLHCLALGLPPEQLDSVPGGQGVVQLVADGRVEVLTG